MNFINWGRIIFFFIRIEFEYEFDLIEIFVFDSDYSELVNFFLEMLRVIDGGVEGK